MGYAPSFGNGVIEERRKLCRRFRRDRIAPSTERDEQIAGLVEGEVAVHHRADAERSQFCELYAVLLHDIFFHSSVAFRNTLVHFIERIRPDAVDKGVFPIESALCDGDVFRIDEHRFYPRRTEFDTENRFARSYFFCDEFCFHKYSYS